ncbi:MAG: hypothetical protein Q4Q58_05985, partial [Thermoplasmata archaeon]|nr:hypothetical protein [Thermoplasmata archaeon]
LIFERDGINGTQDYSNTSKIHAENLNYASMKNGPLAVVRFIDSATTQDEKSPIHRLMRFASHMLYYRSVQDGNTFIGLT